MRYYGQPPFEKEEQADELINHFNNIYTNRKGIRWGIELKSSKELIGTVGFHLWSPNHGRAEIGYELIPSYWNNGFVSEAINKVIEYGFIKMKLHRVGAVVFVENDASTKLLKKIGFEKEGMLRGYMFHNGTYNDTYIYSLINN
ncbi:GNAT family protein [Bacillus sp. JCM 19041]|uniref:GNAT family N-acetyltransferase n=1 Tax=Bacillus sp. JCM 19041 TaxID=1460637 RepID=UPI000A761882